MDETINPDQNLAARLLQIKCNFDNIGGDERNGQLVMTENSELPPTKNILHPFSVLMTATQLLIQQQQLKH